jgi:MerR family transcriptional regulator, light-induced transcriptional regulator
MQPYKYSIGDLAEATGLTVLRIRAWEVRYGKPKSHKLPSGHRRYCESDLQNLILMAQATELGLRIGKVVAMDSENLMKLISSRRIQSKKNKPIHSSNPSFPAFNSWILSIQQCQTHRLSSLIRSEYLNRSVLSFLEEVIGPFLVQVGELWESGYLSIAEEHFASHTLRHVLEDCWRSIKIDPNSPKILLAMLPEDVHTFGLHMAALLCAHSGFQVIFLGEKNPVYELCALAQSTNCHYLLCSISGTQNWAECTNHLDFIHKNIPNLVKIGGGSGFKEEIEGWIRLISFRDLAQFLKSQLIHF